MNSSPLGQETALTARWAALVDECIDSQAADAWKRNKTGELAARDLSSLATLRSWIYLDAHIRTNEAAAGSDRDSADTIGALTSYASMTWPSNGWHVRSRRGASTLVEKHGVLLEVEDAGSDSDLGVMVALPRLRPNALPGWTAILSSSGPPSDSSVRAYLHLATMDAIAPVIDRLDVMGVGWSFKVNTRVEGMRRPDSAVVYFGREDAANVIGALTVLARGLGSLLGGTVPGFSRRLADGLAIAASDRASVTGSFGAAVAHAAALALIEDRSVSLAVTPFAEQVASL